MVPPTFCPPLPSHTVPVHTYAHDPALANAVIGGVAYRGATMPEIHGDYFFSDLGQKFTRAIGTGGVVHDYTSQTESTDLIGQIVGFGTDGKGEMYLMTEVTPGVSNPGIHKFREQSIATHLCPSVFNSTGFVADLRAVGSNVVADDDLKFISENVPDNTFGILVMSDQPDVSPGLDGFCLGSPFYRWKMLEPTGTDNQVILSPKLSNPPGGAGPLAGTVWDWQIGVYDGGAFVYSDGVFLMLQ